MKKLILILAITLMVASQSFGVLRVYLERNGTGKAPALVDVKYSGADANYANLMPRAFAFKIKTNNVARIHDVNNYQIGESNSVKKIYGIYPATIVIDSAGVVTNNGKPLAFSGDPGSGGGLDSNNVVLEFASLYFGDSNAPASSGKLCTLYIERNGAGTSSTVSMTDEDVYRGGLVFEDGSRGDTSDSNTIVWVAPPGPATNGTPTGTNVDLTTDMGWTAGSGATSHDVYFGTSTATWTMLNVVMPTVTRDTGTMTGNTTYYCRVVARNADGTSANLDWNFHTNCLYTGRVFNTTCGGNPPSVTLTVTAAMYNNWVTLLKPASWCCDAQKCGNVANNIANQRVDVADVALIKGAWLKSVGQVGYNADADTNLSGRVDVGDIGIVKSHWLKNVGLCLTSY